MNLSFHFAMLSVLALAGATYASTGACDSNGSPAIGRIEVSLDGTAAHTFYVNDRNYALGNGIWLYQETNGIFFGGDAGKDLQTGGCSPFIPDDCEICWDTQDNPDQLLL